MDQPPKALTAATKAAAFLLGATLNWWVRQDPNGRWPRMGTLRYAPRSLRRLCE